VDSCLIVFLLRPIIRGLPSIGWAEKPLSFVSETVPREIVDRPWRETRRFADWVGCARCRS